MAAVSTIVAAYSIASSQACQIGVAGKGQKRGARARVMRWGHTYSGIGGREHGKDQAQRHRFGVAEDVGTLGRIDGNQRCRMECGFLDGGRVSQCPLCTGMHADADLSRWTTAGLHASRVSSRPRPARTRAWSAATAGARPQAQGGRRGPAAPSPRASPARWRCSPWPSHRAGRPLEPPTGVRGKTGAMLGSGVEWEHDGSARTPDLHSGHNGRDGLLRVLVVVGLCAEVDKRDSRRWRGRRTRRARPLCPSRRRRPTAVVLPAARQYAVGQRDHVDDVAHLGLKHDQNESGRIV